MTVGHWIGTIYVRMIGSFRGPLHRCLWLDTKIVFKIPNVEIRELQEGVQSVTPGFI